MTSTEIFIGVRAEPPSLGAGTMTRGKMIAGAALVAVAGRRSSSAAPE
jgi:hypothetical protein